MAHHRDYCGRGSAARCGEVSTSTTDVSARILAGFLAGRHPIPTRAVHPGDGVEGSIVTYGLADIRAALGLDAGRLSGTVRGKRRVDELVRSALLRLSFGDAAGAEDTVALAASTGRVRRSLARLLERRSTAARRALSAALHAD